LIPGAFKRNHNINRWLGLMIALKIVKRKWKGVFLWQLSRHHLTFPKHKSTSSAKLVNILTGVLKQQSV